MTNVSKLRGNRIRDTTSGGYAVNIAVTAVRSMRCSVIFYGLILIHFICMFFIHFTKLLNNQVKCLLDPEVQCCTVREKGQPSLVLLKVILCGYAHTVGHSVHLFVYVCVCVCVCVCAHGYMCVCIGSNAITTIILEWPSSVD